MSVSENWGQDSSAATLTPEQIIEWLEGYRELMIEVWTQNPELYEIWKRTK